MNKFDFEDLLLACQEIASTYPEGIVFIGGKRQHLNLRGWLLAAIRKSVPDSKRGVCAGTGVTHFEATLVYYTSL
jgi:hypothetical protein